MRTIAHLGNLLVGWTNPGVLSALAETVNRLQPNVVAVSGNLTAAGNTKQLESAREFLESLPSPQIVVPGEKDFAGPGWLRRWVDPNEPFFQRIESNPTPYFADSEILVVGVNTAREGAPLPSLESLMESSGAGTLKIVVSYRPVFLGDKFAPSPDDERVFRSQVDIVLVGPFEPDSRGFRPSDTTLFFSSNQRPEGLTFSLVRLQPPEVVLERYGWRNEHAAFRLLGTESFRLAQARWTA